MKLARGDFFPFLMHSAVEPGASISMPKAIVEHCALTGFSGCCFVEPGRVLAAADLHRTARFVRERGMSPLGSTQRTGSDQLIGPNGKVVSGKKKVQRPFKAVLGIDFELCVYKDVYQCALLAKSIHGWWEMKNLCTRGQDSSEPLQIQLQEANEEIRDQVLLLRPHGKLSSYTLRKIKEGFPNVFLAMGRPNDIYEDIAKRAQVLPIAAPDVHAIRIADMKRLTLWREMHGLPLLDPDRTLVLSSRNAVEQRFEHHLHLVRETGNVAKLFDEFEVSLDGSEGPNNTFLGPDLDADFLLNVSLNKGNTRTSGDGNSDEYEQRLRVESKAFEKAGISRQFVEAYSLRNLARNMQIPAAAGHGYLTSCLMAWALRITDIDPMVFDLSYQQFLRSGPKRFPPVQMTFGDEAPRLVEAYLEKNSFTRSLAFQTESLSNEECLQKYASLVALNAKELTVIRDRLRPRQDQHGSKPGGKVRRHSPGATPYTERLSEVVSTVKEFCDLPWKLAVHPLRILVGHGGHHRTTKPVAPVLWDEATEYGYRHIELLVDPELDVQATMRKKVEPYQKWEVKSELEQRSDSSALLLAINSWMESNPNYARLGKNPTGVNTSLKPSSWDDLVALHGFIQKPPSSDDLVTSYFERPRDPARNRQSHYSISQRLLHCSRGLLLYTEQAEQIMARELRLARGVIETFMDPFVDMSDSWALHWQRDTSRKWTRCHRAGRKCPLRGLKKPKHQKARCSYKRRIAESPLARATARSIAKDIQVVIFNKHSKVLALNAADMAYTTAFLTLALRENPQP